MFKIRYVKPQDIFSVIKIAHESLPEQYNPVIFNRFYETFPEGFLVVDENHKIIGFAIAIKISSTEAKIPMFAISKLKRRKGIGSALLIQLLEELSKHYIKHVELEVRTKNKTATSFYKKHGFDIIDTLSAFYQNGEDAHIMKKRI